MTEQVTRVLQEMYTQGIRLWTEDGRLRFRAPQGAMTAALREQLKAHKAEIITYLEGQSTTTIRPVGVQEHYELSPAQWRLWVLMQMEDSSVAYNVPLHQLIEGPLDEERLAGALQKLVERHESLRTCFVTVKGEPRQKVLENVAFEMELVEAADDEAAWQMSLAEAQRPFDLSTAPLMHAKLVKIAPERQALLLTLHHIVCDGVSIGLLNSEVAQLYGGGTLAPLPVQYKDFAHWQNRWLESGEAEAHKRYWLARFAGELPVLNLPTDFARPTVQTFHGREQAFDFDVETAEKLKQVARTNGGTLFMVLLAALKAFLYRYTQQTDFTVGSPVAARPYTELYEQVGFYLNTLPLRTEFEATDTFAELLKRVRETVTQGLNHQVYPFDRLVNELEIRRDLSRGPLFDVMLILQNQADEGLRLGDLQVQAIYQHSETSKVDLTFNFNESVAGLHLAIEYNTDLFTDARIERMGGQWQALVQGIVAEPERPLGELALLPETEQRFLEGFNETADVPVSEASFAERWVETVAAFADKAALVTADGTLSYAALDERATQLAQVLHGRYGVKADDRVALLLNRTAALPVALLALLKIGAAYVPIDPTYPEERVGYILTHSESKLLVTEEAYADDWRGGDAAVVTFGEVNSEQSTVNYPSAVAGNLAYVTYTSGSTGRPKGVMITQGNLVNFAANMGETWGITADDSILALTTITFDIAGLEILCSLLTGMTVVLAADEAAHEPEQIFGLLERHQINTLQLTPSRLKLLLVGQEIGRLGSLKTLLIGGEALPPLLMERIRPLFDTVAVFNVYGPTEATIWSTSKRLNDGVLNIGRPLVNEQVYVLDPQGAVCPIGVIGEICIGGSGVANGYWQRPGLTGEKFVSGVRYQVSGSEFQVAGSMLDTAEGGSLSTTHYPPSTIYRTGDLGYWLENGELVCLGRSDDQVKIRGFRVELGEVEAGLMRCVGVETAVAAVQADSYGDNQLLGFVMLEGEVVFDAAVLRQAAREQLPEYMVPAVFVRIEEVPMTLNGKVDRKALVAQAGQEEVAQRHDVVYVAPRTALEAQLAQIWAEELERPQVGVHDNFFDLGGHSLRGMRIVAQVVQRMGIQLALLDLFQQQTVAALAAVLEARSEAVSDDEVDIAPMTDEELALLLGDDEW